jgi:hypothetical protein
MLAAQCRCGLFGDRPKSTKHGDKELWMNDPDWISQCADRLQKQWPRATRQELEETARELLEKEHWRIHSAEEAAVMWLRLGVQVPQ